jgi:uncharacterized protein (DUF427 family)
MSKQIESVWQYPRPPRVEASEELVVIEYRGVEICSTRDSVRVLETSHPPTYYVPGADVAEGVLRPAASGLATMCEFKGRARYWDLVVPGQPHVADAAWDYPQPWPGYESLAEHWAFYPSKVSRCIVDGEEVVPQQGDFYGGWITSRVTGPFKGGPGTRGW